MKMTNRIVSFLLALTMCLSLFISTVWASEEDHTSDGSDSSISIAEENPIAVLLSENSLTLFTGKSATLKATVQPEEEHTIRWSSDNKKVATVDSMGKVIAKGAGNCTITATVDDVTATCAVTVKKPTIKLNKTSLSLDVKKTATLKATVDGPSKKVTWKSSNTKIATVDKNGKVTAKKAGKCTITATANGVSASCEVKVRSEKDTAIEAYRKLLSKATLKWNDNTYPTSALKFSLIYIDNDNIPELYLSNSQADHFAGYVTIFAWNNGKVKQIETGMTEGITYYKKKGVYVVGYAHHGVYDHYIKYSKGKRKTFLTHGIYTRTGEEDCYYETPNYSEITKSQFKKKLKKVVGSTSKSKPKAYDNTETNRKKYLK